MGSNIANLESLAQEKLAPGSEKNNQDEENHLAVIAQRFGLDIYFHHEEAAALVENAVASHGRICLAMTQDRTRNFTAYPSEPFLSCIAAKILHKSPKARDKILTTLKEKVNSGLVELGRTGQLVNRLIFLLGKDLYTRQRLGMQDFSLTVSQNDNPADPEAELSDCKMVPIVGYLEYVFGKSFWDTVEDPDKAKNLLANAYINFTHWVPMKHNIGKREGIT